MSISYPSSTRLFLCIQSTSSRTPECFCFHPWNNSPAEWRCTPNRRRLYRMLWGKPSAKWCSSAKFGSHVSLFPVPIFGVNICPFNYGIKGIFILKLTINTQRPQANFVQHPFFPPLNRWSLRLDPNPSSSIFQDSIFKWWTKTKLSRYILFSSSTFGITSLESHLKFLLSPSFVLDRL
jgi:hypothetical protein